MPEAIMTDKATWCSEFEREFRRHLWARIHAARETYLATHGSEPNTLYIGRIELRSLGGDPTIPYMDLHDDTKLYTLMNMKVVKVAVESWLDVTKVVVTTIPRE
jgi:hypothetical protein